MGRTLLTILLLASAACRLGAQPAQGESLPLADIKAGQRGEVWTVFQGTKPEPFAVEVAGIIQNSLGPGKSMILCSQRGLRAPSCSEVLRSRFDTVDFHPGCSLRQRKKPSPCAES